MVLVDLVEEACALYEHAVVAGGLHEHAELVQRGRKDLTGASSADHVARILPCEHVAGDLVDQHHLLLGRDVLRLRELIEAATSLEQQRVLLHELLDGASSVHRQDLEARRVDRNQTRSSPAGSESGGPAREAVEQTVELAVDSTALHLFLEGLELLRPPLVVADGQHEVDDGRELVHDQVEAAGQPCHLAVEGRAAAAVEALHRVHAHAVLLERLALFPPVQLLLVQRVARLVRVRVSDHHQTPLRLLAPAELAVRLVQHQLVALVHVSPSSAAHVLHEIEQRTQLVGEVDVLGHVRARLVAVVAVRNHRHSDPRNVVLQALDGVLELPSDLTKARVHRACGVEAETDLHSTTGSSLCFHFLLLLCGCWGRGALAPRRGRRIFLHICRVRVRVRQLVVSAGITQVIEQPSVRVDLAIVGCTLDEHSKIRKLFQVQVKLEHSCLGNIQYVTHCFSGDEARVGYSHYHQSLVVLDGLALCELVKGSPFLELDAALLQQRFHRLLLPDVEHLECRGLFGWNLPLACTRSLL
mmetsp:Transcript_67608/g.140929  ORF Transcript_67608/g.140929 Transcript_67608/m.140929 type:complete len:529 (-) Transcript_67608:113-1699(-)